MLFNPQWTKTKADPLSLDSLIAWLEEQDGDREYSYYDNRHCLLAQYFKAKGFRVLSVGGWTFSHRRPWCLWFHKSQEFSDAFADVAGECPHTFGAALDRARSWRARGAV